MTAIITANPAEQFRSKAANLMVSAAQMTLHQLVDEFQRLADLIDQHSSEDEHGYTTLTEIGQLAIREQRMVNGAARARFGISFESYDRTRNNCLDF